MESTINLHKTLGNTYFILSRIFLGPIDSKNTLESLLTSLEDTTDNTSIVGYLEIVRYMDTLKVFLHSALENYNEWEEFNIDYTGRTHPKPGGTECYIFESVYATRDTEYPTISHPLVTGSLLHYYRLLGLESAGVREPDHVSVELEFMGALHHSIAKAMEEDDIAKLKELEKLHREFYEKHYVKWIPELATCITGKARTKLLKTIGETLKALAECEDSILESGHE